MTDKKIMFLNAWRVINGHDAPTPKTEYRFVALALGLLDANGAAKKNFRAEMNRAGLHDWRFDFAFVPQKVAVEINGNAWHTMGGGRHGKDADLEKMNYAQSIGWHVFQFSPSMLKKDPYKCVKMVYDAIIKIS